MKNNIKVKLIENFINKFTFNSIEKTLKNCFLIFRSYSISNNDVNTNNKVNLVDKLIKVNIGIIIFQAIQAFRSFILFLMVPGSILSILFGDIFFMNGKARNAIHFGLACVLAQGSLINRLGVLLVERKYPLKMLQDLNDLISKTEIMDERVNYFLKQTTSNKVSNYSQLVKMKKHVIISYSIHEKLATGAICAFAIFMSFSYGQCINSLFDENEKKNYNELQISQWIKVTSLTIFLILDIISLYIVGKDILILFTIWENSLRLIECHTYLLTSLFDDERRKVTVEINTYSSTITPEQIQTVPINFLHLSNTIHKLIGKYLHLQNKIQQYNLISSKFLLGITSLAIPVPCSGFFVVFFNSPESQLMKSIILSNAIQTAIVIFIQTRRVTGLFTKSLDLYKSLTSFSAILSTVKCKTIDYQNSYSIMSKYRLAHLIESVGSNNKKMSFTDTDGIAYTPLSQLNTIGNSIAFFLLYSTFLKDW